MTRKAKTETGNFEVYYSGEYPKKKRQFHNGKFPNRQSARNWCRNHSHLDGLTIVNPNGLEERYAKAPRAD